MDLSGVKRAKFQRVVLAQSDHLMSMRIGMVLDIVQYTTVKSVDQRIGIDTGQSVNKEIVKK